MNLKDYFPRGEIVTSAALSCLRKPRTPIVLRLKVRPRSGFVRREDLEPAEGAVTARTMSCVVDHMIVIYEVWSDLEEIETAIEECAWAQGAWDMVRYSNPPLGDDWSAVGHGVVIDWGGIESAYQIPGAPPQQGKGADAEIVERAGREGYWNWVWKPNCFLPAGDPLLAIAKKGDPSLREDGSRPAPFPGWLRTGRYAGRSGDWWLGLAKSFEEANETGTCLRIVWDFRKRKLGVGR